jgi:CheY-like chemotaxis protein
MRSTYSPGAARRKADLSITFGLSCVVLFFVASALISWLNVRTLNEDSLLVVRTHSVITALDDLLSTMKDAETGQRGYLITGEDSYLVPYNQAQAEISDKIDQLASLTENTSLQKARLADMRTHIQKKMQELALTIELRRSKGFDIARDLVLTDRGKDEMDALRAEITRTNIEEQSLRDKRLAEMANAYRIAIASGLLTGLLGVTLSVFVAFLVRRASSDSQKQEWLQTGQVGVAAAMFGDLRLDRLGEGIVEYLSRYLDAHVAVLYVKEGADLRLLATSGVPEGSAVPTHIRSDDGLVGQAVKNSRPVLIRDVPEGFITVGSALSHGTPRNLIVSPATSDGAVNAVIELGFIHPIPTLALELLALVSSPVGMAIRSALDRQTVQNLLEETQTQAEELHSQSEELRVSNEELEEQSRALKESQVRLEQQQAELEQINAHLEEQSQILETQRDDLNRTKEDLEAQAKELERAGRYKSDFLANMSHELRTPLNSSLILAKLLADNREGNLTDDQVKYAQTIQAAGNDLLALIGDILDLSKIESGYMELQIHSLPLEELVAGLTRTFEPIAAQRSLSFNARIAPGTPGTVETDAQRLEQVLKNLLSNALKFTEQGEVNLEVHQAGSGLIAFSVRDTGIGIAREQHAMVFEAFRQADGTTNRKYGGTGLGLSIAREFAHLLGGEITMSSEPGKGSTFTLTIPELLVAADTPAPLPIPAPRPARSGGVPKNNPPPVAASSPDDRESLAATARTLLVVEDDEPFARILYDLAHEHGFQCLLATSAEAGLALARQFVPSAVLLDIGLPDHSGLSVLDRLKHDPLTRHIPVHVVSGADYELTALTLGAIGYMLKPVKREDIIQAFEMLEAKLTQRLRRVLVVEDDPTQLESMRLLLGSREVETVGVASAGECLSTLRGSTFDCMVLDLSLPDASGFSLLESLSQDENYSFPPVIVYTGRDLTAKEEQQLRRYSRSIIVKGARSPERLLDEVTLFLHQVVAELPVDKQRLIEIAKHRDAALEDRRILIVEDDVRNIFALSSILEPRGAKVEIARNGKEALELLARTYQDSRQSIDLVLMDIMMPEMDGFTAMREIRKRPEWRKLPIIALTAKAMKNDQEQCLEAGANDYIAKPLDVEKLLSLIRVWMPL